MRPKKRNRRQARNPSDEIGSKFGSAKSKVRRNRVDLGDSFSTFHHSPLEFCARPCGYFFSVSPLFSPSGSTTFNWLVLVIMICGCRRYSVILPLISTFFPLRLSRSPK